MHKQISIKEKTYLKEETFVFKQWFSAVSWKNSAIGNLTWIY
jgi:hypothetical protein